MILASDVHQVDNIAPFYDFSHRILLAYHQTFRFQGYDSHYTQSDVTFAGSMSVSNTEESTKIGKPDFPL
jgi:hypothetical protein